LPKLIEGVKFTDGLEADRDYAAASSIPKPSPRFTHSSQVVPVGPCAAKVSL